LAALHGSLVARLDVENTDLGLVESPESVHVDASALTAKVLEEPAVRIDTRPERRLAELQVIRSDLVDAMLPQFTRAILRRSAEAD
jgi:hypothetical protein